MNVIPLILLLVLPSIRNFEREEGLSNLTVRGITCDNEGEIWLATRDGLNRYDGNSFTVYRQDPDSPNSIGCNILESIMAGRDGRIWVGSDIGLSIYDPRKRSFENHLIPEAPVRSIFPLDDDRMFLKCNNGCSIFNGRTRTFSTKYMGIQIPEGQLCAARTIDGDTYFHIGGTMIRIPKDGSPIDTLGHCPGVFTDIDIVKDELWVCCDKNGMYRYDAEERQFRQFGIRQGLSSDNVRAIEYYRGNIWAATFIGVDIIGADGSVSHANLFPGESDSKRHAIKCIEKDLHGGIWAGSFYGGAARVSYSEAQDISPAPYVYKVEVNGKELMPSDKPLHGCAIRYTDKIKLRSGQNNLRISFRTVNLEEGGSSRFEYRLEGYDTQWCEQEGLAAAVYQGLKPGNYTFRVKSANRSGVWSGNDRILRIRIRYGASFYVVLATLLLISALLAAYLARRRKESSCLVLKSEDSGMEYRFEGVPDAVLKNEDAALVKKILKLIEDNMEDEEFSTEKLSSLAGMSRSSLHEKLSGSIGISANTLINEVRFTNARILSESGKYTLGEISDKTGFSNKYYFSSAFKKRFGYNPGKARAIIAILLTIGLSVPSVAGPAESGYRKTDLPEALKAEPPVSICTDRNGFLWLYSGQKAFRYDGREFLSIPFECDAGKAPEIHGLFCDLAGRVWASTGGGTMAYDKEKGMFIEAIPSLKAVIYGIASIGDEVVLVCSSIGSRTYSAKTGERITGLFPSEAGIYRCVAVFNSNVFLLSQDNSELFRWSSDKRSLEYTGKLDAGTISLIPVSDNALWACTDDGRTLFYRISGNEAEVQERSGACPERYQDRLGNLHLSTGDKTDWILTPEGELYSRNPRNSILQSLPGEEDYDFLTCISSDAEGDIWLGNPNSNVIRRISREGAIADFAFKGAHNAKCILCAGRYVYVGFYKGGMRILEKSGGRSFQYGGPDEVHAIVKGTDGNLWVASTHILYQYDTEARSFRQVDLPGQEVRYIKKLFVDSDGELWLGAESCLKTYASGIQIPEEIRRVNGIAEYPEGTIWIATGYGLWKCDKASSSFEKVENGILPSSNLFCIEKSDDGRLWLSSGEGIFSFEPKTGHARAFNSKCGHTCSQYIPGGSGALSGARLAFCGVGGATIIDPARITTQTYLPTPFIESCADNVQIKRGKSTFTIKGNVADYTGTEDYRALYKLDGYDREWIEGAFPLEATYDRVGHGSYTFRLKCVNADGATSEDEQTVSVTVGWSALALTCFFSLISLLVFGGVILILVRKEKTPDKEKDAFIANLEEIISNNYRDKDFSVDRLAGELRMSRTVLYEKMSQKMGTTPSCFLKDYRIKAACSLLDTTDKTIQQIADLTGFSSQSHFTAVFRKETGQTPSEYRKNKKI